METYKNIDDNLQMNQNSFSHCSEFEELVKITRSKIKKQVFLCKTCFFCVVHLKLLLDWWCWRFSVSKIHLWISAAAADFVCSSLAVVFDKKQFSRRFLWISLGLLVISSLKLLHIDYISEQLNLVWPVLYQWAIKLMMKWWVFYEFI